jgi:hypothetical protein
MSKVYNYMVMSVFLIILLKFAGLPTGADSLLVWIGISSDISQISLGAYFLAVAGLFSLGAVASIVIGYYTKSSTESTSVAPIALGIFTVLTSTFVSIINYTKDLGFVYYIMYLIFVPLLAGFAVAIIQFWRGVD